MSGEIPTPPVDPGDRSDDKEKKMSRKLLAFISSIAFKEGSLEAGIEENTKKVRYVHEDETYITHLNFFVKALKKSEITNMDDALPPFGFLLTIRDKNQKLEDGDMLPIFWLEITPEVGMYTINPSAFIEYSSEWDIYDYFGNTDILTDENRALAAKDDQYIQDQLKLLGINPAILHNKENFAGYGGDYDWEAAYNYDRSGSSWAISECPDLTATLDVDDFKKGVEEFMGSARKQ